jgi:hypothetical protein
MRNRRAGAYFDYFWANRKRIRTLRRMTQSDAKQSPMLNSLITRENTGNFDDFGRLRGELWPKKPCLLSGFRRNSLLNGTGNFETSTANYFAGTGNFLQITGKLH